jgi:serine phosphatase RsbU (regulator of sigma subunit)
MVVNTYMEILIYAVLFVFIYLIIKKVVVNKIQDVNASLAKITSGNLNETINVRSNVEFASLSDDINSTVDTLKHYIDEASARIDKELEFAKNIQCSALPTIFPAYPNKTEFDIFATMTPAKEVGGDFYDFYFVGDNTLAFLIADVSGKGIPAAMFMMTAKTLIKNLAETSIPVEEVFTRANEELCKMNDAGMFVTAWMGELDLKTGVLSFVNAGHNPPLIKRGNGEFEFVKTRSGLVLAGMEGINYRRNEIQLMAGDKVFLYTDGVTEATNANVELYGEDRLLAKINSVKDKDCTSICKDIKESVDEFVGEAEQFDDITMLALDFNE